MISRILFTGAQGTGKTSVMDCLPTDLCKVRNITRTVAKDNNLAINTDGSDASQQMIFDAYTKALEKNSFFVAERSLIDVYAYTLYQSSIGKCTGEIVRRQRRELKTFIKKHENDIYVYFPIEFEPVYDGVRSVDKKYQKAIDEYIKDALKELKVRYITVSGSIEHRVETINGLINENIKRTN